MDMLNKFLKIILKYKLNLISINKQWNFLNKNPVFL